MSSLVKGTIATMDDPTSPPMSETSSSSSTTSTAPTIGSAATISSIPFYMSFQDWWSSSSHLMLASSFSSSTIEQSPEIQAARLKNRMIEYELFTSILPDYVHVYPPNASTPSKEQRPSISAEFIDTVVSDEVSIHEFYLENNQEGAEEQHIVIIHGYMAALGYFVNNISNLISTPGVRLHLIDLPGFGNSSRPIFPAEFLIDPTTRQDKIAQIKLVEGWFIDCIELWRIKRGLEKFNMIAHSMGAYLTCCYLMKYNKDSKLVDRVVIVSPMGTESSEVSLISGHQIEFEPEYETELTAASLEMGRPGFPKNFIIQTLWNYNKSPFQILQKLGPFYSKILSYWSFRRFKNHKSEEIIMKLHRYSYSIFNQFQGSGELAITKFINHEILARLPLCERGLIEYLTEAKVKTLWLYGDKDWMNYRGGEHIHKQINKSDPSLSQFMIVENAGHHIYLDNPTEFDHIVAKFFNLEC
ncbi:hypothetical protein JA1_004439 [Spathaspora sp. JA1]|nr:hypothetical protein JA1_004439 [Spathaspora sp. JA1]